MALAGPRHPSQFRSLHGSLDTCSRPLGGLLAAFVLAGPQSLVSLLTVSFCTPLHAAEPPAQSAQSSLPAPRPLNATVRDEGWTGSLPGLEPNPHRTFNLSLARPGMRSFETKNASTSKFSFLKMFGGSREFPTSTYNTREFLPSVNSNASKSFATNPFSGSVKSFGPASASSALASKNAPSTPTAPGAAKVYEPPLTPDASRGFAGQEAERMKLPLPPGGGPNSGVTTGRQLTVEEVKAILNKSK